MSLPRPPKPPRERLDVLVAARGLAPSRERAQGIIMAGQVLVEGHVSDKPGTKFPPDAAITLATPDPAARYVSRGALKLERALDAFALDPQGRVALDVGASTGGFTDLLLQRAAVRVFAVDVGQGQLAWRLREDPRVVVLERTNIRSLRELPAGTQADCAVMDVSFISLRLVLPHVLPLIHPGAWIVALVKPQFEAGKREADRGNGVIRDPAVHARVLSELLGWLATDLPACAVQGLIPSPITGRDGNHEYLLWLAYGGTATPVAIDVAAVVTAAGVA
ncbi:MAG: TlyA family RNA methyltransferase [Ktedonobacterales bacterium]|nr:TlyA family RNA methyltransferase [Ktedonobacterales bacterium]